MDVINGLAHFSGQFHVNTRNIVSQLFHGCRTYEIAGNVVTIIDPREAHLSEIEAGFVRDFCVFFDGGVGVRAVVSSKSFPNGTSGSFGFCSATIFS